MVSMEASVEDSRAIGPAGKKPLFGSGHWCTESAVVKCSHKLPVWPGGKKIRS